MNDIKDYRLKYDYHTHTTFSHGKGSIEDNVKVAISKGLKEIAISDHGPGHLNYGVKRSDFPVMRREVDRLNEKYPQIKIYLSVEANILSRFPYIDVNEEEKKLFDFVNAGYHYGILHGYCVRNWMTKRHLMPGKGSLMVKNTDMTIKALYNNDIKILTHPGDKGPFDIAEIAKACADTDTLMEINMKHPHLTTEEIEIAAKEDVRFIISSDAHVPDRVGIYEGGLMRAFKAGLDPKRIVNIERI